MLTPWQNKTYRPLVEKAWRAHCGRTAGSDLMDKVARDQWYRKQLMAGSGVYTTKQIGPQDAQAFDGLCLHFATIACDMEQIAYWSTAEERRALWRLDQNMKRAGLDWPYVRGIAKAMHLLDKNHTEIQDLPAEHILKLATALFLYMKRKERKAQRARLEEAPF